MRDVKHIRLFVSCPSDIEEELDSIGLIVDDINKTIGKQNSYVLELLDWKRDTYTQMGDDAQDVINSQIELEYDILISLMWLRFGTPTKRDLSGTVEEINRSLANGEKLQLIFFKTAPPINLNDVNTEELAKINDFKKNLSRRGVLYKEFNTNRLFETLFRIQLINLISDKLLNRDLVAKHEIDNVISIEKTDEGPYSYINNLISEVENSDEKRLELDIFKSVEESQSYLNSVTVSLDVMTEVLNDWTEKLDFRTDEISKISKIKDERLRLKKQKIIIDLAAEEMIDFKLRIENELPIFSENFKKVGESYSNVFAILDSYGIEDSKELRESAISMKESSEKSLKSMATLLKNIMGIPPLNFKFNSAKRETEIVVKNLLKEIMEGVILLDAALKTD